jgi:hypothetical protein
MKDSVYYLKWMAKSMNQDHEIPPRLDD